MKVEIIDDGIKIFLQNIYFKDINWDNKEEIINKIKKIFIEIGRRYNINIKGLYKIKVYPHKLGVFIDSILLNEDNYNDIEVDLRIMIIFNKEIYLKLEDISFLEKEEKPFIYKDNYYLNIDDVNNILKYIEYGQIVCEL